MPKKVCLQCGERQHHSIHTADHAFVKAAYQGLRPVGEITERFNRSEGGKEYRKQAKQARGKRCLIQSPVCTGSAEHLHEPLSRGRAGGIAAALRDGPPPIPSCDACNGYVSDHPQWGREHGWLLSRKDVQSCGVESDNSSSSELS